MKYRVVKPCYAQHRGGLRHFRAGVIVDLDPKDVVDLDGYVVPARRIRKMDLSADKLDSVVKDLADSYAKEKEAVGGKNDSSP